MQDQMSSGKKVQTHYPQSWSDLPTELAGLVLCRLPSHIDRVCFAAVCRHWRFTRRQHCLPPPLPCLALPDGTFVSLPNSESFDFSNTSSYHSSSGEWLVFSCAGTCSLMNPFSMVTLSLPHLSCFRPIDEPAKMTDGQCIPKVEMPETMLEIDTMSIRKLSVCSVDLVAAIV